MVKKDNTVLWVIGIILFLIVVTKLPLPQFAIITTTTCADGVENYYSLDGNFLDLKADKNIMNYGTVFITGKLGSGALEFNGTNYISFPSLTFNNSVGFWLNNYSNQIGWTYLTYEDTSILSSTFMLGLNGSVDEIVVGTNISGFSNIQPCYTVSYEENISCKDYATEQVVELEEGCLNYSGDFFPSCEYEWISISQYQIIDNICEKYFYCQDSCLAEQNCYETEQSCIENLTYDCYINENDVCIHKTDYLSCDEASYSNLTECQESLPVPEIPDTTSTIDIGGGTPAPAPAPSSSFMDKLNQEVFEIAGFSFKISYLIIILIIIVGTVYYVGYGRK